MTNFHSGFRIGALSLRPTSSPCHLLSITLTGLEFMRSYKVVIVGQLLTNYAAVPHLGRIIALFQMRVNLGGAFILVCNMQTCKWSIWSPGFFGQSLAQKLRPISQRIRNELTFVTVTLAAYARHKFIDDVLYATGHNREKNRSQNWVLV